MAVKSTIYAIFTNQVMAHSCEETAKIPPENSPCRHSGGSIWRFYLAVLKRIDVSRHSIRMLRPKPVSPLLQE